MLRDTADVRVMQVVITQLSVRGEGVEGDPVRRIIEVWTTTGQKIAEWDPYRSGKWETLEGSDIAFDGSPDDRTPSLDSQRRDALRR